MKFIRYGDLKAFEQVNYKRIPNVDEYPHAPPRKKGMFAFPYCFFDSFYIMRRPACNPNSTMMYLRDKTGRKLTEADLHVYSETETLYNEKTFSSEPVLIRDIKEADLLKSLGLPKQPIQREQRPSWVCIMKDASNPPQYLPNQKLNQEYEFLIDKYGDRVSAADFFEKKWRINDFSPVGSAYNDFWEAALEEICVDAYNLFLDDEECDRLRWVEEQGCLAALEKYLTDKGISVNRLFVWPVYKHNEEAYLTVFKKPHLFSYNGCLWHHLRGRVPPGSILSSYGTTWVYTTVRDFERALSHAEPKSYRRYKKSNALAKPNRFGGPYSPNGIIDTEMMYEVFFDEDDIKKIT